MDGHDAALVTTRWHLLKHALGHLEPETYGSGRPATRDIAGPRYRFWPKLPFYPNLEVRTAPQRPSNLAALGRHGAALVHMCQVHTFPP